MLKNVRLFIEATAQHGLASNEISPQLSISELLVGCLGFPVNQVKAEQILKCSRTAEFSTEGQHLKIHIMTE